MEPNQSLQVVHTSEKREFAKVEGATGKVYKKQIITFGKYVDPYFPEWPMDITPEIGERFVENFNKGVVGRVQLPWGYHSDNAQLNAGELIGLELDEEGVNGILDIRRPECVEDIENGLLWDNSISFTLNYQDEKGVFWGPVILHVALVNNPYITQMGPFQALSKLVSDLRYGFAKTHKGSAIMLSKQVNFSSMDTKKIKNAREFDVTVNYQDAEGKDQTAVIKAGEELEVPTSVAEGVEQQITAAEAPKSEDGSGTGEEGKDGSEGEDKGGEGESNAASVDNKNGEGAGVETNTNAGNGAELSKSEREELEMLRNDKAEAMYSKLVEEGKVLPAQKEAIVSLAKTAGPDKVAAMFSNAKPVVDFSEKGSQNSEEEGKDNGNGDATDLSKSGVRLWKDLSKAEQDTNKILGISEEQYNKVATDNPKHFSK